MLKWLSRAGEDELDLVDHDLLAVIGIGIHPGTINGVEGIRIGGDLEMVGIVVMVIVCDVDIVGDEGGG